MTPDIFFASRLPELLDLRLWVHKYGAGRVWVSECSDSAEQLSSQLLSDPDSVRVACLRQVQASRYMICVFNGEYGSVVATETAVSLGLEVSLLELELITAVLTRVPTVVLLLGDVPHDARTQDLWAILEQQRPVRYRAPLGPARKPTRRLFWRPGFASPEERRGGTFYSNSTVPASICNVVPSSFIRRVRSSFNCWAENAGSASRKVACFSINRDAKSAQVSGKTPMVR